MSEVAVAVIVLTYNEEADIRACLESVEGWAQEVYVVDSGSTDCTVAIAREFTPNVCLNAWVTFAKQREWAINHICNQSDWIFFLDADERLTPDLKKEITSLLSANVQQVGFRVKRRFFFLGRWLKHGGYYPLDELRLMRRNAVRFADEGGGARESFLIDGPSGALKNDMLHVYDKGLLKWIEKHVALAKLEAACLKDRPQNEASEPAGRVGSRAWLRAHIWSRLPFSLRPVMLFFYRYVARLGFLDGLEGFYYCVLHDLWYPLLIDALNFDMRIPKG